MAAIGLAGITFVGGEVGAAPRSQKIAGTFDLRLAASAACPDPTCARFTFRGVIRGPGEGPTTAIFPAQPPSNLIGQGLATVHTSSGDVHLAGSSIFNPDPASDGEIVFNLKIVGGTGAYAGAGGYILAFGPAEVPGAVASNLIYTGRLTLP